jgi:hypothetical protein
VTGPRTEPVSSRRDLETYTEWRERCLQDSGFEADTASWLASAKAFDLHALLELVHHDCPPELAVRIVAPLEWDGRWAFSERERAPVRALTRSRARR